MSTARPVVLRCSLTEQCTFHRDGGAEVEKCPGICDAPDCTADGWVDVGNEKTALHDARGSHPARARGARGAGGRRHRGRDQCVQEGAEGVVVSGSAAAAAALAARRREGAPLAPLPACRSGLRDGTTNMRRTK